jgi:hypothetical protein
MARKRASGPPKETNIEPVNNERKREKTEEQENAKMTMNA